FETLKKRTADVLYESNIEGHPSGSNTVLKRAKAPRARAAKTLNRSRPNTTCIITPKLATRQSICKTPTGIKTERRHNGLAGVSASSPLTHMPVLHSDRVKSQANEGMQRGAAFTPRP
ncbi:unnamed protein product, partial [Ectocarpus sp. 6 AP-2014]